MGKCGMPRLESSTYSPNSIMGLSVLISLITIGILGQELSIAGVGEEVAKASCSLGLGE